MTAYPDDRPRHVFDCRSGCHPYGYRIVALGSLRPKVPVCCFCDRPMAKETAGQAP